uniref:Uncharacterized protein n=1 Tax=viral metagenome TaxID=1070528 RepID=A0A6M3IX31_9ZZZZ
MEVNNLDELNHVVRTEILAIEAALTKILAIEAALIKIRKAIITYEECRQHENEEDDKK